MLNCMRFAPHTGSCPPIAHSKDINIVCGGILTFCFYLLHLLVGVRITFTPFIMLYTHGHSINCLVNLHVYLSSLYDMEKECCYTHKTPERYNEAGAGIVVTAWKIATPVTVRERHSHAGYNTVTLCLSRIASWFFDRLASRILIAGQFSPPGTGRLWAGPTASCGQWSWI